MLNRNVGEDLSTLKIFLQEVGVCKEFNFKLLYLKQLFLQKPAVVIHEEFDAVQRCRRRLRIRLGITPVV